MTSSRFFAGLRTASPFLVTTLLAGGAFAQVTEPNGRAIPAPVGAAEVAVVTGRGFPADAVTLEGLFKYRSEMISPTMNALKGPGAFSPLCGFTGQMMIRGGGCQLDFAWYNATTPPTKPAANELYTLIPKTAYTSPTGYACMPTMPGDFCPLATRSNPTQPQYTWKDIVYNADNIRTDPRYKGGLVGFAITGWTDDGNAGHRCTDTHYSQNELNATDQPWIAALMWQSTVTPDSYYIGFEDWPMSAANWSSGANDGDFNDFVFFVSGITCKGAGQPCTVPNAVGACAAGKTDCDPSGQPTVCRSVYTPHTELCDNLDNDCNGIVDDGDGLCPAGKVCDHGTCVGNCQSGEFKCAPGLACKDGHCIDPLCLTVNCQAGQVCQAGQCIGACDGVVCPLGQSCQLGRCIDPCAGVDCSTDTSGSGPAKVCEQGVCVSDCTCRGCVDGQVCATAAGPSKGKCVDMGCDPNPCAAGQICQKGQCIDPCTQDVHCPGGAACMNGVCGDPVPGVPPTGSSGGSAGTSVATGGIGIVTGTGDTGATATGVGTVAGDTAGTNDTSSGLNARRGDQPASGCNCRTAGVPGSQRSGAAASAGLLVGLALLRSRMRRSRRDSAGTPSARA